MPYHTLKNETVVDPEIQRSVRFRLPWGLGLILLAILTLLAITPISSAKFAGTTAPHPSFQLAVAGYIAPAATKVEAHKGNSFGDDYAFVAAGPALQVISAADPDNLARPGFIAHPG